MGELEGRPRALNSQLWRQGRGWRHGSWFLVGSTPPDHSFPPSPTAPRSCIMHPISHIRNAEARGRHRIIHGQQEARTEQEGAPGSQVASLPRRQS